MKKIMACFLAAVMTIAALPINIFAEPLISPEPFNLSVGTGRVALARLSRSPIVAPERSAFVEARTSLTERSGAITSSNLVDNWIESSNLNIIFEENITGITTPLQFIVELDNAQWFFREGSSADTGSMTTPTFNPDLGTWDTTTNTYTRDRTFASGTARGLLYTMEVSRANPRRATITITGLDTNPLPRSVVGLDSDGESFATLPQDMGNESAVTLPSEVNDNNSSNTNDNPEVIETSTFQKKGKKKDEVEQQSPQDNTKPTETSMAPKPAQQNPAQQAMPNKQNPKEMQQPKDSNKPQREPNKSAPEMQQPTKAPQQSPSKDLPKPQQPKNQPTADAILVNTMTADAMDPYDDMQREMGASFNTMSGIAPTSTPNPYLVTARTGTIAARTNAQDAVSTIGTGTHESITTLIGSANTAITNATTALSNIPGSPPPAFVATVTTLLGDATTALTAANSAISGLSLGSAVVIPDADRAAIVAHLDTAIGHLNQATTALDAEYISGGGTIPGVAISIMDGDSITIPIVARSLAGENDLTIRVVQATPVPIQSHTLVFGRGTGPGRTTTAIQRPSTGRDRIEVGPIGVFENRTGIFPSSGQFELVAPSGYHFANVANARVSAEGGISFTGSVTQPTPPVTPPLTAGGSVALVPNSDARVARVVFQGLAPSTTITGQLVISDLVLVSNNPDVVREGDIYITIRNVSGSSEVVTQQDFVAATVSDWRITLETLTDVPTLVNGRLHGEEKEDVSDREHRAARVRVEEVISNAWWGQRSTSFTLPPEVRVRKVQFRNIRNINNPTELTARPFYNERGRGGNTPTVRVNDNVVTLSGLDVVRGERASFEMELWLNVESGYEGDINLTIGGSGITPINETTPSVTVAESINPISINADLTNVRMGYTFMPVGDFRITENVAGALRQHEEVYVSVTDEFFSELHIASNFRASVTEGDLLIRNVRASNNLGFLHNNNLRWRMGTNAIFEIDRESTKPSTVEFTNVSVRLSPNVPLPATQDRYDLIAWGTAVAANFEGVRDTENENINRNDFFNTPGIVQPFINVTGTGQAGIHLTNIVRVTANNPVLSVNGEQMLMDTAPYVSTVSDSLMVPVRFVSMALGLEAGRVMWSPSTSTVTIDAGDRILQFRTNSSVMLVNGIELPMLNALGNPVYSEVRDERAFIPFRAFAEALNVYVEWDAQTATATFDPTRPSSRVFHLEDVTGEAFFGDLYTDINPINPMAQTNPNSGNNILPRPNTYYQMPNTNQGYMGYNQNNYNVPRSYNYAS